MRPRILPLLVALTIAGSVAYAQEYEVWLVDQSDTQDKNHGGRLYIFDGAVLSGPNAGKATAREIVDLSDQVTALCHGSTGANPVRPHMLLFNRQHSHAVLSFVVSGHVVILDAATRVPLACMQTTQSATGRQAHAAYPAPDGSYIVVANQNGKRLERIDADFKTNKFVHNPAATLDLATCTTPSGKPCQSPELRPDNAPICPVVDNSSALTFVTLRGGGLFVVDSRRTPMRIVAEYDKDTVHGNGCGGGEAGGQMYLNSGGRPGKLEHLSMYGFDVYRFPLRSFKASGAATGALPAPTVVFAAEGERDSHGMVVVRDRYVWVFDRHANVAEIISTKAGKQLATVQLTTDLSRDPAPDLADISPAGDRIFVALRGPTPLSGDPHIATGTTPGLGVIEVNKKGDGGRLAAVVRITNVDAAGVEKADAHAVRVRRK